MIRYKSLTLLEIIILEEILKIARSWPQEPEIATITNQWDKDDVKHFCKSAPGSHPWNVDTSHLFFSVRYHAVHKSIAWN